jgi:quinoprotein dehydrogenase-associated probable ABC transporter substrate-binding protein
MPRRAYFFFCAAAAFAADHRILRVCADPNNLPYSNAARQGLDNRMAMLLSHAIGAEPEFTWLEERRSYLKNSLLAERCDVVFGAPSGIDAVSFTRSYYTSGYVLVTRKDRGIDISSLLDERLAKYRIGVHLLAGDYAPPAAVLAQRGLASNLVGFSLFGAFGEPNPAARMFDALNHGRVDVVLVWGPLGGYYAGRAPLQLEVRSVTPAEFQGVPFTDSIAIAVRKENVALLHELNRAIVRECRSIQALLVEYGVPQVGEPPTCESPSPVSQSSQ